MRFDALWQAGLWVPSRSQIGLPSCGNPGSIEKAIPPSLPEVLRLKVVIPHLVTSYAKPSFPGFPPLIGSTSHALLPTPQYTRYGASLNCAELPSVNRFDTRIAVAAAAELLGDLGRRRQQQAERCITRGVGALHSSCTPVDFA
eukprot:COSAG05_NODE_1637_length_4363_cov_2.634146_8_plen_144_part_00